MITGGVAQGSVGSQLGQGVAQGSGQAGAYAAGGGQGFQSAPRHSQSQHRHPTALLVSTNRAVSVSSFFIIRISNRDILRPSRSRCQSNSTPRFLMCKRNLRVFCETRPVPNPYVRQRPALHLRLTTKPDG